MTGHNVYDEGMYKVNDSKGGIHFTASHMGGPNSTFNNFNEGSRKIGMSVNSGHHE
jgi:hypothetical protein